MQGDFLVSTRSLTVPPTVPPAKKSTSAAQRGDADMQFTGRLVRVEDHLIHGHAALSLLVERECQDHDDLGDETPAAEARRDPDGRWWLR